MTAIADASGDASALWPWWVWAILAGVAGCIWLIQRAPHIGDAEPSTLDRLDGVERCTVNACTASVTLHVHSGFDYWPMCEGHGVPFLVEDLHDGRLS